MWRISLCNKKTQKWKKPQPFTVKTSRVHNKNHCNMVAHIKLDSKVPKAFGEITSRETPSSTTGSCVLPSMSRWKLVNSCSDQFRSQDIPTLYSSKINDPTPPMTEELEESDLLPRNGGANMGNFSHMAPPTFKKKVPPEIAGLTLRIMMPTHWPWPLPLLSKPFFLCWVLLCDQGRFDGNSSESHDLCNH